MVREKFKLAKAISDNQVSIIAITNKIPTDMIKHSG